MSRSCRQNLDHLAAQPAHAGLLLAYYLKQTDDQGKGKRALLGSAITASQHAAPLYRLAFERWKTSLSTAPARTMKARGRVIAGLGSESVLETGIRLHHTYGTPLLPGSSLKGLAAHFCDEVWSQKEPAFSATGEHYKTLFGVTDDSGHIRFHDAWILPASLTTNGQGLLLDVMTPHHPNYYVSDDPKAPSDFDDPNPVAYLSVSGTFYIVVECDVAGEEGKKWAALALDLLVAALREWGIGGKTSSGYGRLESV